MSNTWFRMIRDSQEYIEKISNQLIKDKKSQHMQVLEVMGTTHFSIYCDSDKKYMILKFWKESKKYHNIKGVAGLVGLLNWECSIKD